MEQHKLKPLTEFEKAEAERNHNLVYSFLHRHRYSIEEMYNVVIFGYLKGIQVYYSRENLRNKYQLAFICEQYMRAEVGNHFRIINANKRMPEETILSLDAEYAESDNLYNCICGISFEEEVLEKELLSELLEMLTALQRKIVEMRMEGYKDKEIYLVLNVKPSTFYKELQRIKRALYEVIG